MARSAAVLAVAVVMATLSAGCAKESDDGDDLLGGGGGNDGGSDSEAPPMPDSGEIDQVFDEAITTTGAVDAADLVLHVGLDISGGDMGLSQSSAVDFEGAYDAENRFDVEGSTRSSAADVELNLLSDGETAWLQTDLDQVTALLPEGAEWIEAPFQVWSDAGVVSAGAESFEMLPFLRGAESAEDGGVDEVYGTEVRVFTGSIDEDKAMSESSPDEQAGLESSFSITEPADRFDYEVAIDGDGRIRSVELRIEASDTVSGASLEGNLSLEVQSFDQQVEVEAPPSDEIVLLDDVPGLLDILRSN
jgi:hypothetical protein